MSVNIELKPVIFGSEPAILDTESFSEISLDQPSSDLETYPEPPNPLQDDQFSIDYSKPFNTLTQATQLTASLSQLPSVASSVFSSFSNILKGASPTPTSTYDQQQVDTFNILPPETEETPPLNTALPYASEESSIPAVAPTFYSTDDPVFLPPAPALSPPPLNATSGNAYRLTTKRKTYAPAPGLSHQDNQTVPSPFSSIVPPLPQQTNFQANQPATYQNTAVNQPPPSQNTKFSFTSFFPTPLLEKITGASTSHTQEAPIAVPDVFAAESTNPPVTVNKPALFDTNPVVPERNPNFFPAEIQSNFQPTPPLNQPLFFNPAQQTSFSSVNPTQSAVCGTIESVPSVTSIPPTGNISNYRLRGKPHYKNPLSSTPSTTPLLVPFPQATPSPVPCVGIFNPGNVNLSSEQQIHSTQSSGFAPPNINFFNQPQSVQPEHNTPLANQFVDNNTVSASISAPVSNFDTFSLGNVLQPPKQLIQPAQTPFVPQPYQLQPSQDYSSQLNVIETLHPQAQENPFLGTSIPPIDQTPLDIIQSVNNLTLDKQPESSQQQNFFNQPIEAKLPGEEPSVSQLQPSPFVNPFAAVVTHTPTESSESEVLPATATLFQPQIINQGTYSEVSNSETQFEAPFTQTFATNSVSQIENKEEPLGYATSQQSDVNLNKEESSEGTNILFNSQQDNYENLNRQADDVNLANSDSKNSSAFDIFFNKQQPEFNLNYSEATAAPQSVPTSNLASSFFETSSNSSVDWFNPSKTVEPTTNQFEGDINRNTQAAASEQETLDPSSFFNANNNQTSSDRSPPNYFQIQNFFNNPPLISDSKEQDNNFNFIENNLINKRLHNLTHKASTETDGSISSNIVEPPSSAQSEFSEFAEINPETVQSDDFLGEPEQSAIRNMASSQPKSDGVYRPVYKHWFYLKSVSDRKPTWTPFSMSDSLNLEEAFNTNAPNDVRVNGGRYDVCIEKRCRTPVYWNANCEEVRRCSWFYVGSDSRTVPYDEKVADALEEEYKLGFETGKWNRRVSVSPNENVHLKDPTLLIYFSVPTPASESSLFEAVPAAIGRGQVRRGLEYFHIDEGEPEKIDHLLFMVHGIGSGCDLKFRSIEEVVEDFRTVALSMTKSHYSASCDRGEIGRIEILPVSWHAELHSEESGIDEKLKAITLDSIPKLRTFTNETLLDILFYSSPVYCQKIIDTVAGAINKTYTKFCERNPDFNGHVSLAGHSLGSLILFDLLQHQRRPESLDDEMDVDSSTVPETNDYLNDVRLQKPLTRTRSRKINYTVGPAGTGQPYINYPQLVIHPKKFFAIGSPIGMFVTVRGIDNLGLNYKLPTTDGLYNIFHPLDPVAYRIEALVNPDLIPLRPVLIPHHKGRKRMHLEFQETMARIGADIKQKVTDAVNVFIHFLQKKNDMAELQQEVDRVISHEISLGSSSDQRARAFSTSTTSSDAENPDTELPLGALNEGKRIDYVLQEAPLEFFNEYLFALTSHVCYWDSADTVLFIVKEIYTSLGIKTDSQIPQQSMTIERPISASSPTTPNS
ncbi:Phospholipase DDHD2 [Pseudolycoriella hygida]|uniref:Phospholipase DDHD2 n=1 Tax=Pseudolycoriella hygida TaxID=35572 RepID=A0A9Q0MV71_9DIPT|nr:Phospholipase DDHD2 [Pseudolycoriella hygida]